MLEPSQCAILVVDDVEVNIDILLETLGQDYKVRVAMNGEAALQLVEQNPPDLILLDIMMPEMDGYEVCRRLKAQAATRNIPVIFLTSLTQESDEAKGLTLGAVDYITKPFSVELVKSRVRNHLQLKCHQDHLEELVRERTRQLELTQAVTIKSLGTLAEYRDPETGGHIKRTQMYVRVLAEHLKLKPNFKGLLDDATITLIEKSAPLHDIGKVGVPDHILLKPGKLTAAESEEMKKHTRLGRDAIAVSEKELGEESFLRYAKEIAYTHHEKWDGSGYPQGLQGCAIPVSGRLMAIADVYDALISKRVYKPPFPHAQALAIISQGRGTHFDPEMVDAFFELADQFRQIALAFADFAEEKQLLSKAAGNLAEQQDGDRRDQQMAR